MNQNNFTILETISESGTTTVYKAHQSILDRTVVLKVLHKHLLRDKNLVARFSREAKACAILQCENIVQVYDLTELDSAPTIVIEFIEGKSLQEMLLDGEHSDNLMIRVATSVLKALAYAHSRGVVHRDIKPGNILVSGTGVIKVTDFGLATISDAPSVTMEGSLIGTPAYMSPEQVRGETVDGRTDLFSLGITLIEVLTGERLLAGSSYSECMRNIQNFQLDSIEKFSDKIPRPVFEFLKRLLAPDRNDRFASAEQALDFLQSSNSEAKIAAKLGERDKRKRRTWIALAAFCVLLVVGLIATYVVRNSDGRNAIATNSNLPDSSNQPSQERDVYANEIHHGDLPLDPSRRNFVLAVIPKSKGPSPVSNPKEALAKPSLDSGFISITCSPWAEVNMDSEYIGRTPIAGSIKAPPGRHVLTFSNPFFVPIIEVVAVSPKTLSNVDADFLKNAGYILITVDPWADIYVDDLKRDTTPMSKPIIVSAGTRKLRLHNPAFQDIVQNLKIDPGDTLRLKFNFQTKQ